MAQLHAQQAQILAEDPLPEEHIPNQDAQSTARHRLSSLFVNHTKKTCLLALTLPILSILLIVFTGALILNNPSGSDYSIRNDIRTRLEDAQEAVYKNYPFKQLEPTASLGSNNTQQMPEPVFHLFLLFRGLFRETGNIPTIKNHQNTYNVLTREGLELMKHTEDLLLTDPEYPSFCLHDPLQKDCQNNTRQCAFPQSVLNHPMLFGIYDGNRLCDRKNGSQLSDDDFSAFLNNLKVNSEGGRNPYLSFFTDQLILDNSHLAWASRSTVEMGIPFRGYDDIDDSMEDQEEKFSKWAGSIIEKVDLVSTNTIDASAVSFQYMNSRFNSIVTRDLSFAIFAVILVFFTMWFHTTSLFLASSAMLQIILSFPLSYAFYYFVCRQGYFSALQILTIFLVLGIGADDVFVFTDAWKQAAITLGAHVDLITRMSWTYRRAVRAMTVTSFTTAAAFFVTATSPIMPISTLGVWAGLLILIQYFLVITVYPCALIIWHRFWRPRLAIRFFKKVDKSMVEKEAETPLWHRFLPPSRRPAVKGFATGDYRPIERFFRGPWYSFVFRFRFVIVILALVFAGLSVWRATKLEPPVDAEQFLPSSHPLLMALITLQDAFPISDADELLNVVFTWGVVDIDRKGTSKFNPDDLGDPILDETFDFTKKEVQEHIYDVCRHFNRSDFLFQGDSSVETVNCWIMDYGDWRVSEGKSRFTDFSSGAEQVKDLYEYGRSSPLRMKVLEEQHVVFDYDESKVIVTSVRFADKTSNGEPYRVMWPVYEKWHEELKKLNNNGPPGGNNAIITGGGSWVMMITQRTLISSMYSGIGIMMAVAFCTLVVATLNWCVSILAILCIAFIIALLLGVINLLGWHLGITETIAVVISVGYSFDGVAHIATAYIESLSKTRGDKARDALTELGISILFGVISTLLAGFMLFPAVIIFFVKFAALIVLTVAFNLVVSLCLFPALLITCGPTNEFGSLVALYRRIAGGRLPNSSEDSKVEDASGGTESKTQS